MSEKKIISLKILLIEDNPGDARLINEILKESKKIQFNIKNVKSLSEGIQSLLKDNYDILLLDLSLPDSKGIKTFDRIKEAAPQIPILVLTGLDDEEIALKVIGKGAQDYIIKDNIDFNLLFKAVLYAIERFRLLNELEKARRFEEQQKEIRSLMKLSKPPDTAVTAQILSLKPLAESKNVFFEKIVKDYCELLDNSIEQKVLRIEYDIKERLNLIAEKLGELNAGPRDVISLHTKAVELKIKGTVQSKAFAYIEEGRILLIELMGYLLSFYRNYYFGFRSILKNEENIGKKID